LNGLEIRTFNKLSGAPPAGIKPSGGVLLFRTSNWNTPSKNLTTVNHLKFPVTWPEILLFRAFLNYHLLETD
jgi:hypothetical protein